MPFNKINVDEMLDKELLDPQFRKHYKKIKIFYELFDIKIMLAILIMIWITIIFYIILFI